MQKPAMRPAFARIGQWPSDLIVSAIPGPVTGHHTGPHGIFSEPLRLLLEFGGHLPEPLGDGAIRTHSGESQAALDLLLKIRGICHCQTES